MNKKCLKCEMTIPDNLNICPFCGKKFKKNKNDNFNVLVITIIIIIIIFMIGFSIYIKKSNLGDKKVYEIAPSDILSNDENVNNSQLNISKTYKTNSQEYHDYLKSVLSNLLENNREWFSSCDVWANGCAYFRLNCYANTYYHETQFVEKVEEIQKEVFNELIKNNYKSGSIFTCNYDIVQLNLYNRTKDGSFYPDYFLDYHMNVINNYNSYEDYIEYLKN